MPCAQNTVGVAGVHVVPTASLQQQMNAVLSDIGADAVKTGMLPDVQVRSSEQAHGLQPYNVFGLRC